MGLRLSSIAQGTPLGIKFTNNLDENDCVDLRIIGPDGMELKQNPGDLNFLHVFFHRNILPSTGTVVLFLIKLATFPSLSIVLTMSFEPCHFNIILHPFCIFFVHFSPPTEYS